MTNAVAYKILDINLRQFDNTQTTGSADLSVEMKEYYSSYLVDVAKPKLVHSQWAQKHPIPAGNGKVIEFRRYSKLPKALTPLTEGVTPSGRSLKVTKKTATVDQYGDYVELSDRIMTEAIDNNMVHATELLGVQSGETIDTLTREVLNSGSNVQYGNGKLARYKLVGGESSGNDYLSPDLTRLARRNVKTNLAEPIDGRNYVGIIHTDAVHDLQADDEWKDFTKYAKPEEIYEGEVGKLHNIRFVETTEAKKFVADDLSAAARELTVASITDAVITIDETLTAGDQAALAGRKILVNGVQYTVVSATNNTITCTANVTGADGDIIYPGEAGAKGRDVYTMVVIGKDAYGETEVSGESLKNIIKNLGSAGSADPLDQRATTGWKATHVAEILADEYLLRVEHCTAFNDHEEN
jgi:N4-gp56 family major capsid protein